MERTIKGVFVIFPFLNFAGIDLFGLLIITKRKRLSQIRACHVMSCHVYFLFARNGPLCCQDTLLEQFVFLVFTLPHSTMQRYVSVFIWSLAFSKGIRKELAMHTTKQKYLSLKLVKGWDIFNCVVYTAINPLVEFLKSCIKEERILIL